MRQYLLAHDLGTSGNKATLFTVDGELVASETSPYETDYSNQIWAEQDPHDWWQAVCRSTAALIENVDSSQIAAVCLSGQMMGCLCVDKQGRPLRPSIIYCDQRAVDETAALLEKIDEQDFYRITGHRASASYSIEKLMWLKTHEPDVYRNTHMMLNAKDFINYRLTGEMATDYSDASGTNCFDLNTYTWSERIVQQAGIDAAMLPEPRRSTDVLGTVTTEASRETGLPEGLPVVVGAGDGSAAGVGVGCIKPGITYNYLGSSSWIALTTEKPVYDEQMRTMSWAHAVPGYLQPSGTMQAACASYNWLKNEICRLETQQAQEQGISPYELIDRQIENSPPGANGIIFLPYLLGERSPRWNPNAKGAFIGLNLAHKREDLLRSVLEGISYNLEIILGIFRGQVSIDVSIDAITVIGGGAKSPVWRQILADVYNVRIRRPNYLEEATSMGAAVIGGVGVGAFEDFDVINRFIKIEDEHEPIEANREAYLKTMPVFDRCYDSLRDVYQRLADL